MAADPPPAADGRKGLPDLESLPITTVLALARQAMDVLAQRLSGPTTLDSFERVVPPRPQLGWTGLDSLAPIAPGETAHGPDFVASPALYARGSLPVIHREVEALGRVMAAVHTSLAGHATQAMQDGGLREPLLGIPGGARPFRDASDWMVQTLRISRPEARQRVRRAQQIQPPAPELSGHQPNAACPVLAGAFLDGDIDPASLDLITRALQDTRKDAAATGTEAGPTEQWLRQGEEMLTSQATVLDAESMRHACARWRQWAQHALNPDGAEPSDGMPNLRQGLTYQGKRRQFHQWKILADDLQHEVLSTIAGAATNPRATGSDGPDSTDESSPDATPEIQPSDSSWAGTAVLATDPRTRHQRQLDGLTSALMAALSLTHGNGLPDSGGGRPLIMVSIDYQTLARQWKDGPAPPGTPERIPIDTDLGTFRSEAIFTGPISPTTIRALACDSDLLPVVLGGTGQVLDVGRTQRLFPARLRKAVTARDGGCAAPGCTMPAPWTEVHHVQWWTREGPTSVDNGVLLCNRHHTAVHAGSWDITVEDGVPWFVPAPFIDPFRKPLRNQYWRP